MQVRLSRDPHEALGIPGGAGAPEVRNAFLSLTKQFHPAKFARMATDVQKLANEVFLALRAAHDCLSRASVTPKQSGPIPTLRGPQQRALIMPTSTPTNGTKVTQPLRSISPATRPSGPWSGQPLENDPARARLAHRSPPATSRSPSGATPTVARTPLTSTTRPAPPVAGAGDTDRELSPILQLFADGQVAAARVALESLTTRSPTVVRFEALLHYAKGREAQLAKQIDVARVELQDALQLDPELQLAKTALAELFTRRK